MIVEGWELLVDTTCSAFYAGTVFRFPAQYPYEAIVDFMLICDNSAAVPELRIVTTTGNKSGFMNLISEFPKVAYISGAVAICPRWTSQNWQEFIYKDCKVNEVYVLHQYPTASQLPMSG